MPIVVYSSFLIVLNLVASFELDGTLCGEQNTTSEPVRKFCHNQGGYLIHRCCRASDNRTFIAIDLTDLDLRTVPNIAYYLNYNLSVIDLRSNPQLEPTVNDDFLGLIALDELILPLQFDCPGQDNVWEKIENISDPLGIRCLHQKDFCVNLTDVCVEQASHCGTNGPNHFRCICKEEYHGYKCLRKGNFPTGVFFGATISVTIVASFLLYWTQRRHVKS